MKKIEISDVRDKLSNGVAKLESAGKDVAELQVKLREMQPVLQKTQKEVEEMMIVITKDKQAAAKEEEVVVNKNKEASAKAAECAEIKASRNLVESITSIRSSNIMFKRIKKIGY